MKDILIVDDETPIREWIEMCAKAYGGIEHIYTAQNGKEAKDIVNMYSPQVIFTDITMPKVDGLELLEYVKEKNPTSIVVIMSVHKDFEFVRQALKCGASNYIVKNEITKDTLFNIFDNIKLTQKNKIETGTNNKNSINQMIRSKFINSLLEEEKTECTYDILINNNIELNLDYYFVVTLPFLPEKLKNIDIFQNPNLKNKYYILYRNNSIVFIANANKDSEWIIKEIYDKIKAATGENVGYSELSNNLNDFKEQFLKAVALRDYEFYLGEKVLHSDANFIFNNRKHKNDAIEFAKDIEKVVTSGNYLNKENLINKFNIFADYLKDIKINDINFVRILLNDLITKLSETDNKNIDIDYVINVIMSVQNFDIVCQAIYDFFDLLTNEDEYCDNIKKALAYVSQNYMKNISMSDVARELYLNEEYFSRLFKKECKLTFTDYLNNLRMEKAKELILYSNIKINLVGEEVGIKNSKYFSLLFKKHFGMPPSKMRENL